MDLQKGHYYQTCTVENADEANSTCDCGKPRDLVADLAINSETGQAEKVTIQTFLNEEQCA